MIDISAWIEHVCLMHFAHIKNCVFQQYAIKCVVSSFYIVTAALPECKNNPCKNDGTCGSVGGGSYNCTCKPNFRGKDCECKYCGNVYVVAINILLLYLCFAHTVLSHSCARSDGTCSERICPNFENM